MLSAKTSTIEYEKKSQSLSENLKNLLNHLSTVLDGLTRILNADELKPYKKYLNLQCMEEDEESEDDYEDDFEEDSDMEEDEPIIKKARQGDDLEDCPGLVRQCSQEQ